MAGVVDAVEAKKGTGIRWSIVVVLHHKLSTILSQ